MRALRACHSQNRSPRPRGRPQGFSILASQKIGKYFIAPPARRDDGARSTAWAPIHRARASLSHDRVTRVVRDFDSHPQASHVSIAQALAWIGARPFCTPAHPMTTE